MKQTLLYLTLTALWGAPEEARPQGAPGFPQGTYIYLDAQDPHAVTRYAGIEVEFTDGRYVMRRDDELRVEGRYTIEGDRITIVDQDGPWACADPESQSATYLWRQQDDQLVLMADREDRCNRRRNRLSGANLIPGDAPPPLEPVEIPAELESSWKAFWVESDEPGWIERMFMPDAVAMDGNRTLNGIEEIKSWLGGQSSQAPQAFPFEFARSGPRIIERGRYRDIFGTAGESPRVLVGRYEMTWTPGPESTWKVQQWILR